MCHRNVRNASVCHWMLHPLGAIGALAGWIPALRASRIDPARVLRDG
jgi:ABC-type lipoprotein release transport system permease subunit